MDENERITAVYLGALLLDGIIPADSKIIKRTIESLKRAASHIDSARPVMDERPIDIRPVLQNDTKTRRKESMPETTPSPDDAS